MQLESFSLTNTNAKNFFRDVSYLGKLALKSTGTWEWGVGKRA